MDIVCVTSSILILLYIIVAIRVFKGSRYQFLFILTIMLLLSNIFAITANEAAKAWSDDTTNKNYYLII